MTLEDIKDWLKTFDIGENFYIGKLDNKKEKSIGVYQRRPSGKTEIAIGGLESTKTVTKQVSILVHWNRYANETEEAAQELYNKILKSNEVTIAGEHVKYIRLEVPEPIDVGTDDNGVYERVIWTDFIYERKE